MQRCRPSTKRSPFLRDERGGIFIIVGLSILILFGVVGISVDLGRQQLLRARMQQSSDAGALAAASMPLAPGTTSAQAIVIREAVAKRYFKLNFTPSYLGFDRPAPTVSAVNTISVKAAGTMPTSMMGTFNTASVNVGGNSVVTPASGGNAQPYRVMLVMDNSGSMGENDAGNGVRRIDALRNAARTVVDALLNPNTSLSKVGGVTWSDQVIATQGLTESANVMHSFLDAMSDDDGTISTVGMARAKQVLDADLTTGVVKAVILLTDGSNGSRHTAPYETKRINPPTLDLCTALKNSNVLVYTIAFGKDVLEPCRTTVCSGSFPPNDPQSKCKRNKCSSSAPGGYYAGQSGDFCEDGYSSFNVTGTNAKTYCPRPMLLACATSPDRYFEAPDATTLQNAFAVIIGNIQKTRIIE